MQPELPPVVLTQKQRGRDTIIRSSLAAKNTGITVGMSLSEAKARTDKLLAFAFNAEDEIAYLKTLTLWCYRFSPICAADLAPETKHSSNTLTDPRYRGINLNMQGSSKLFKSEENLLQTISSALKRLGLQSRMAITPSLGASWALSRYAPKRFTIIDNYTEVRHALAPLPVTALRLSRYTEDSLFEVNISRIEDLFNIPLEELAKRFPPELFTRIRQISGQTSQTTPLEEEPITAMRPRPILSEKNIFSTPLSSREVLKRCFATLLDKLLSRLAPAQKKLTSLELQIKTDQTTITTKRITLSSPSNNRKHLWALLESKLDVLCIAKEIQEISLVIPRHVDIKPLYTDYLSNSQPLAEEPLASVIDALHNTLGQQSVNQLTFKNSWLPEYSFQFSPRKSCKKQATHTTATGFHNTISMERPSLLFNKPQQIYAMAMLPDHPPAWIKWHGKSYRILQGIGPERICTEWWRQMLSEAQIQDDSPISERDYFRIQLPSGTWIWIYRNRQKGNWFIHGIWA